MANIVEVEEALKNRIVDIVKDKTLLNSSGDKSNINILRAVLPPKGYFSSKSLKSEYPFILIRSHITEDIIGDDSNSLNFKIFIGICVENEEEIDEEKHFTSYEDGHLDILNLYDSIRIGLKENISLIYENRIVGSIKKLKLETYAVEENHPYSISMVDIDIIGVEPEGGYLG